MINELRNLSTKMKALVAGLVVLIIAAVGGAGSDTEPTEEVSTTTVQVEDDTADPTDTREPDDFEPVEEVPEDHEEPPADEQSTEGTPDESEPEPTVAPTTEAPTTSTGPTLNQWGGFERDVLAAEVIAPALSDALGNSESELMPIAEGLADLAYTTCESIPTVGYEPAINRLYDAAQENDLPDDVLLIAGYSIGLTCPDLVPG